MDRSLPPLTVATLGRFTVDQGGEPLPETAWGRGKALELFLYFLTQPEQMVSKERVTQELWPERDAEQQARDFKVALNALSDALEPGRPPRTITAYLQRQGSSYGLATGAPWHLDYRAFEARALAASRQRDPRAAAREYREALAIYGGDFLPDHLASDWTAAPRERLQTLFLASATELARLLLDAGNPVEAVHWATRVLQADPLWEAAARLLMAAHAAQGNRAQAVRAYRDLEGRLAAGLGLGPMRETRQLYERLLAEE